MPYTMQAQSALAYTFVGNAFSQFVVMLVIVHLKETWLVCKWIILIISYCTASYTTMSDGNVSHLIVPLASINLDSGHAELSRC